MLDKFGIARGKVLQKRGIAFLAGIFADDDEFLLGTCKCDIQHVDVVDLFHQVFLLENIRKGCGTALLTDEGDWELRPISFGHSDPHHLGDGLLAWQDEDNDS